MRLNDLRGIDCTLGGRLGIWWFQQSPARGGPSISYETLPAETCEWVTMFFSNELAW